MKLYKRKLQFVAGSTYSISLPKEWVNAFNLKPQQNLNLIDSGDGLVISPEGVSLNFNETSICVDNSEVSVEKMFVFSYYYGFEKINFYSKKEMCSDVKNAIRNVVSELPGVEIVYEDKKKISIKIMFESLNVDLFQIYYRINLLIESFIENISEDVDMEEVRLSERSVDRLYHLAVKIITMSITNRGILQSSNILEASFIPSLLLIGKRLENIADNLKTVASYYFENKNKNQDINDWLTEVYSELNRAILYLMGKKKKTFSPMSVQQLNVFKERAIGFNLGRLEQLFLELAKYVWNIHGEVSSIDFYKNLK